MATSGAAAKGIRDTVGLMFSNNPTILDTFKIAPRKPRTPLTAAARLAATEKAKATRLARGTMGKKQKARADFHEPLFRLGAVELSAVA